MKSALKFIKVMPAKNATGTDFTLTIAFDVVKSRDESAFSDYSDQVSRRMGFIPIPLSIMLIRVVSQTFSFTCVSNLIIFDVLHPPAAEKGFTMSEVIRQLENIADAPSPYSIIDERTPRRTKSFAHLARSRRDTSEPPASTEAEIENKQRESVSGENREREDSGQDSPRKKVKEEKPAPAPPVPGDDSETLLSDVTAYTMLQPEQGVQRIE